MFKPGDIIEPREFRQGFPEATVIRSDDKYYHLKIMCGTATVRLNVLEENYQLKSNKKKKKK